LDKNHIKSQTMGDPIFITFRGYHSYDYFIVIHSGYSYQASTSAFIVTSQINVNLM
jgi:hypothetical protein